MMDIAKMLQFAVVVACWQVISAVLPAVRYEVTEQQPSSTFVGNIVTDANLADHVGSTVLRELRYRITDEATASRIFVIDPVTGILRTRGVLDREALCPVSDASCTVSFDVAATRSNPDFYDVVAVTVDLKDVNDNAPSFPMPVYDLEIPESATPPVLYNLPLAKDPDSPVFSIKRYVLNSAYDNFKLNVMEADGTIRAVQLSLVEKLDRETKDKYEVSLTAEDGGNPPKQGVLVINITVADANDNGPKFVQDSYIISVAEDTPVSSTVLRVKATDEDIGINGRVYYSLAPASEAFARQFQISENTGEIVLQQPLDFETSPIYHLIVQAHDGGVNSQQAYADVTIYVSDVNDQAPSITINTLAGTTRAQVSESANPGQFVAHVSVKDTDTGPGGNFTCYSDNDQFQLRKLSSQRYELVTATGLDRESQETVVVGVVCTDMGSPALSSSKQLTVVIQDENDNSPVFSQDTYHHVINENNQVGEVILQVNATDLDLGQNAEITYSIIEDPADLITIDGKTGLIRASAVYDYEKDHELVFVVQARDHGDRPRSGTATVVLTIRDTNDEPPRFTKDIFHFNVYENEALGSEVGRVIATDADSPPYNQIEYSLAQDSDFFTIDTQAGVIRAKAPLDREQSPSYSIVVIATNVNVVPLLSSTATVQIDIQDINDNAPIISFPNAHNKSVSISNQVPVGHRVAIIQARDADYGQHASLHYALIKGNKDGYFDIDRETGIITTTKSLSSIDLMTFSLSISVSDGGNPPLGSESVLEIKVNKSLAYEGHKKLLSGTNVTIVIALSVVSAVIVVILLIAIIVIKARDIRQRRHKNRNFRYSIEVEKQQAKREVVSSSSLVKNQPTSTPVTDKAKDVNMFANNPASAGRQRSSLASYQHPVSGDNQDQNSTNSWPKLQNPDKPPLPPKQKKPVDPRELSVAGLQVQTFSKRPSKVSSSGGEEQDSDSAYSGDMSNTDSGRGLSEDSHDHVFSHGPAGLGKPACEPIYTRPSNHLHPRIQYTTERQSIPQMIANNNHACVSSNVSPPRKGIQSQHAPLSPQRYWDSYPGNTNSLRSMRSWESLPEDDGASTTSGSYVVDFADLEDAADLNCAVTV